MTTINTRRPIGEPFTAQEIGNILRSLEAPQDKTLIRLMLECGPKPREVINLRPNDVHEDCVFLGTYPTQRLVRVSSELCAMLKSVAAGEHLWTNDQGMPLTRNGLRLRVQRLLERAGVDAPGRGLVTFRRTFCTLFLEQGGDIAYLRSIIGDQHLNRSPLLAVRYTGPVDLNLPLPSLN